MERRTAVARAVAAVAAALSAGACGDEEPAGPVDPDTAPVVAVDRFSDAAGTFLRRSLDPSLPAAGEPLDLDAPPFAVRGLGPAGEPVTTYDLDVRPRALVPVYRLRRAGENGGVPGQLNLFDYVPGDHGYNDLWRLIDVEVPADYVANTITSTAAMNRAGFRVTPTATIVNCPMVPAGSVARLRTGGADPGLARGWYQDQVVYYFLFEEAPLDAVPEGSPVSPVYVSYAVNPGEPGGGPMSGFRTEPDGRTHNVLATLPGDAGYSPLRSLRVYDGADFDDVVDLPTAEAARRLATDEALVNLPVVATP